jgi:integrase
MKLARISHCTLHDLRRTFCTYLAVCSVDPLAAQKLAGHSSPMVTAKHYVALVPEMLKAQERLPFWENGHTENSLRKKAGLAAPTGTAPG